MTAPLNYSDFSSVIGSWPILPELLGNPTSLLLDAFDPQATILGVQRETATGYDVGSKTFNLYVDSDPVVPVTFSGTLSLDNVISEINTAASATVAFRDNGFLRIKSPTSGAGSYLRLESDVTPTNVLFVLGLFPGIEARGGQITQAQHADPKRQTASPGQLTITEGEDFTPRAFNRSVAKLSSNIDRSEGLLSRKRLAVKKRNDVAGGGYTSDGYQFVGTMVYSGNSGGNLDKLFTVLDPDGREIVKRVENQVLSVANAVWTNGDDKWSTGMVVSLEPHHIQVQFPGVDFSTTYPEALPGRKSYIRGADASANFTDLSTNLYKVVGVVFNDTLIIDTGGDGIGTGAPSYPDFTPGTTEIIQLVDEKCTITKITPTFADVTDVEGLEQVKSSETPTRVELGNRIYASSADFVADGVVEGDLVEWTGTVASSPFSNLGVYRVSRVLDKNTLELVGENFGPVLLNPDLATSGAGSIEVRTDGHFYDSPFIHFDQTKAIPTGDIQIVYLGMDTFRDITADPLQFAEGLGLEYTQKLDDTATSAIALLRGESDTDIDSALGPVLNQTRDLSRMLETFLKEHYYGSEGGDPYNLGRHRIIRPDRIDMWPEVSGTTFRLRVATADTSDDKFQLVDTAEDILAALTAAGSLQFRDPTWSLSPYAASISPSVVRLRGVDGDPDWEIRAAPGPNNELRIWSNEAIASWPKIDLRASDLVFGLDDFGIRRLYNDPNDNGYAIHLDTLDIVNFRFDVASEPRIGFFAPTEADITDTYHFFNEVEGGAGDLTLALECRASGGLGVRDDFRRSGAGLTAASADSYIRWSKYQAYDGSSYIDGVQDICRIDGTPSGSNIAFKKTLSVQGTDYVMREVYSAESPTAASEVASFFRQPVYVESQPLYVAGPTSLNYRTTQDKYIYETGAHAKMGLATTATGGRGFIPEYSPVGELVVRRFDAASLSGGSSTRPILDDDSIVIPLMIPASDGDELDEVQVWYYKGDTSFAGVPLGGFFFDLFKRDDNGITESTIDTQQIKYQAGGEDAAVASDSTTFTAIGETFTVATASPSPLYYLRITWPTMDLPVSPGFSRTVFFAIRSLRIKLLTDNLSANGAT